MRSPRSPHRLAIVLSGGGARGAYEAGVLSYLFERIYPQLGDDFEFDLISGTSVGAIHAAYAAASAGMPPAERSKRLIETWREMSLDRVFRLSPADFVAIPLRALGFRRRAMSRARNVGRQAIGGLVDVSPLEQLVRERIPWTRLRANIARRRPGALSVSCTEIRRGLVTVFMDGELSDVGPWDYDPNATAVCAEITERHVRASAALPFLFPAVRVGDRYYLDGGVRMNTPLSPALRLQASRVLVIALKFRPPAATAEIPEAEIAVTQPAFLLGKVLDILLLDQIEYELQRLALINAMLDRGAEICGSDFRERMNVAISAERGVGYRKVETTVVRPSADLGAIAAEARRRPHGRSLGALASLIMGTVVAGVPADEADLLSYLFFDGRYTEPLIELGRADAREREAEMLELLTDRPEASGS